MKQFECVIFDWAGTTVDYGCFAPVQAFVEVFNIMVLNLLWRRFVNQWGC